ncbi:hypothetical protein LTR08_007981 [Meristemomyces frigidus]|nr:hypothetical protein LTR08_007981 [Meristemomyces frigidus]
MRDRRNTNLSTSSASSSSSTASVPSRTSLSEKRHPGTPPSSPELPSPVTRSHRPRVGSRRLMAVRTLAVVCCVLLFWRCFTSWPLLASGGGVSSTLGQELVGTVGLPDEPTALLVTDSSGHQKWTVAIPQNASFPLRDGKYNDVCKQGEDLSRRLNSESRLSRVKDWRRRGSYYAPDRSFLDIADAEQSGALPASQRAPSEDVCLTSLTFALNTDDVSFGKSLLMLWLSYGLAKKENRAFFVDDSQWPYGKYTSYFAPPPPQGCSPPLPHHILPCPHQAKHLLVSAATASWTFGSSFEEHFTHQRVHGARKYQQIYSLVRAGYEGLFKLVGNDAEYAQSRIAGMKEDAASHGGSVVGMQIRRGDQHPHEYQYRSDYLPLERYAAGARSLFRKLLGGREPSHALHGDPADFSTVVEYVHSPLLLASDDPDVIARPELSQAAAPFTVQKAQERILLATKATLDATSPVAPIREPGSAYVKHIDENSGWEGGFYSGLFHSLGIAKTTSDSGTLERLGDLTGAARGEVPRQAMRMRELVARAYLLDLAVLGESDGVVCAVSSAACRILGVMLGWDAVVHDRWVNVDDGRPWSWDGQ